MSFRASLSRRISVVFAVLLLACCGASIWLQMHANVRYEQEVTQRLSRGLAAHIAENSTLMERDGLNPAAVSDLFDKLMAVNPSVEVYLLGLDGRIQGQAAPPGHLKRDRVDLAPIRQLLDGAPLPIVGDDPRGNGTRKVFSAAPLRVDGREVGYVYVVLSGEERDALLADAVASNVLRTTLWSVALVALLGLIAGLAAFRLITRPLRELTGAVRKFENDGVAALQDVAPAFERVSRGRDEIATLAQAFAQMTRRIAEQWRELTQQDQQRRELFANISHDLRTPLTSLHGYLETLLIKADTLDICGAALATSRSRWRRAARSRDCRRSCSSWHGWNTASSSSRRSISRWPIWCRTCSRSSSWQPRRGSSDWWPTSRRTCRV